MLSSKRIAISITAFCLFACAPAKPVEPREAAPSIATAESSSPALAKAHKLYDLYAPNEKRLTPEQIKLFMKRFAPEAIDLVSTALSKGQKTSYSFDELYSLLEADCITLTWLKSGKLSDVDSVAATIKKNYPLAHDVTPLAKWISFGWSDATDSDQKTKDIVKRGVIISKALNLETAADAKAEVDKFVSKKIWADQPSLAPTSDDRSVVLMALSLELTLGSQPDAPTSFDMQRHLHQEYFAAVASAIGASAGTASSPLEPGDIENLDWSLDLKIASAIEPKESAHFTSTFPKLASMWPAGSTYFDAPERYLTDLLVASVSDDVIAKCDLKTRSKIDKQFLYVFLLRVTDSTQNAAKNAPAISCEALTGLFNPDAVTFGIWKAKLAYTFASGDAPVPTPTPIAAPTSSPAP